MQTVIEETRVPVSVICDDGGCCESSLARRNRFDLGLIVIVVAFVLRRKRR